MKYWPQQLSLALWCAATACGISRGILLDSGMQLSSQLRAFFRFTSTSQKQEFFSKWAESKAWILCWETRSSAQQTTHMTSLHTRKFAPSLEWSQRQISASHIGQTTVLGKFSFMFPDMALHSQSWAIPARTPSLSMKEAKPDRNTDHQFDYLVSDKASKVSSLLVISLAVFVAFLSPKALFLRFQDQIQDFFQYFQSLQLAFTFMLFIKSINLGLGLSDLFSQSLHLIFWSLAANLSVTQSCFPPLVVVVFLPWSIYSPLQWDVQNVENVGLTALWHKWDYFSFISFFAAPKKRPK